MLGVCILDMFAPTPAAVSHPAEEIGRGDQRVAGQRDECEEREPHRDGDLIVEPIFAEPRHPQVVARRGR